MRPIRLEVEGFACYRERQQPLDFSALTLFAIAGPTGAGKSSILDTMLYALYGEVPRIGKQGIGEFISHGRDTLSVCLDFQVRGSRYRVTRRVKRRGKAPLQTTATLADVTQGAEKSLADGVRPVNEKLVELLGLGYNDFIQTVVLPQGDFAKFLKAKPTDQRAILQHLLRHDVFTRMRDTAEERRRDLDGRLRGIDGQLSTYTDATAENLATREALLVEACAHVDAATTARDAADAELQEARQWHALTQEVIQLREQRRLLETQAPAVERARLELAMARRAMPILPLLEACDEAAMRAAKALRARDEAARVVEQAAADQTRAAREAKAAATAAGECDDLARRVRGLDEIAGDIDRCATLGAALNALPPKVASAHVEVQTASKSESAARIKLERAQAALQRMAKAQDAVALDEPLYARLENVVGQVADARALEREVAALALEAEGTTRARATAERDEQIAHTVHEKKRKDAEAAARDALAAQTAVEDGRARHSAAALRQHLHAGDNCPVCLQTVVELPKVEAPPELAALEKAASAAADRATKADRARQEASNALATAAARVTATVAAADVVAAKTQARAAALADLLANLTAAVPGAPATGTGLAVLDWIEKRRTELRAAKDVRDRQAEALHTAKSDVSTAQLALARAEGEAKAAISRHEHVAAEQARLQADLDAVVARIQGVTTSDDPRAERQALADRVTRLRDGERTANEALIGADLRVTTANERRHAFEAALSQGDADVSAARDRLTKAMTAAGFVGADEVKAAVRTTAQQGAFEAQVTKFGEQRAGVLQRLAELEPQMAGREMSAEALTEVEGRRRVAMDAWQAANQQVTTLTNDVARLQEAVKARATLATERDAVQTTLGVTTELATDLKGDRFQEYLLEEAFKTLVVGASVRMRAISNRYTLEWEAGEFYVVDHDNAGERRRAATLSGGETFMASLCLALQLSDEVLRTSGALQMDSLFIDEGFGTLDPDSLSEVTDAIEKLGQDRARLIGVISHRAELTDRLPGCIRIEKGTGESRWVLDRIG